MGFKGSDPCYEAAKDDEPMFVLLGRDACAPEIVEEWCRRRWVSGKNERDDAQIKEAMELAQKMRRYRDAQLAVHFVESPTKTTCRP